MDDFPISVGVSCWACRSIIIMLARRSF